MFRKYTNGRFDGAAPDVSGPAGGYGLLSEQYTKLEKALSLCAKAKLGSEPALKSASWGMGQVVMGFNWREADTNPAFEWFRPWCAARMHSWPAWRDFLKPTV